MPRKPGRPKGSLEGPYQCKKCGKLFQFLSQLKIHYTRKTPCMMDEYGDEVFYDKNVKKDDNDKEINNEDNEQSNVYDIPDLPMFPMQEKFNSKDTPSVGIFAIRRSGKSTMIKYIYPHLYKEFDIVIFLSNSIHNEIYDFVKGPKFNDYYPEMISDIMKFNEKTKNMFTICIITDDLVSYQKKNSDEMLQLFVRGRNVKISPILSSQGITLVNNQSRNNLDYCIIGNFPSTEARKVVVSNFISGNVPLPHTKMSKSDKEDYYNQFVLHHTKDHSFIILDNIDHKVYKFKTPMN
jgi:molybdopterin-guanine dinucleotide biosynthesis protein